MVDSDAPDPNALAPTSDALIDSLLDHPYFEPLEPALDALVRGIPLESEVCERTTILSWIYLGNGVITFLELADRITGNPNMTLRKKTLRGVLRVMEKLHLIGVVNFPGDEGASEDVEEDVIGRSSMISLTWTGMVWMRRAWAARAARMGHRFVDRVHQEFVAEEDEGKGNDPYWVENVSGVDPEMMAMAQRATKQKTSRPPVTSIFDLGRL